MEEVVGGTSELLGGEGTTRESPTVVAVEPGGGAWGSLPGEQRTRSPRRYSAEVGGAALPPEMNMRSRDTTWGKDGEKGEMHGMNDNVYGGNEGEGGIV